MPTDIELLAANNAATEAEKNHERAQAALFAAFLELNYAKADFATCSAEADKHRLAARAARKALQELNEKLEAERAAAESANRAL
jgi:hypothetical protein